MFKAANYVYEIYRTNANMAEVNNIPSASVVNVGYPGFLVDVINGAQKNCPVPLDFEDLHDQYYEMTSDERADDNKAFREFLGRCNAELAEAYPDRAKMLQVVREKY